MTRHPCGREARAAMTAGGQGQGYRLVLRGEIGDHFAVLFEGMELERGRGMTALTGPVRDQAHLHGLIERIADLGIDLVSVNPHPKEDDR